MGKSTARIARKVITSMCVRYVVNAGTGVTIVLGEIAFLLSGVMSLCTIGYEGFDEEWEDERECCERSGIKRSKSVGKARIASRSRGLFAKIVMDNKRGIMSIINSVIKFRPSF